MVEYEKSFTNGKKMIFEKFFLHKQSEFIEFIQNKRNKNRTTRNLMKNKEEKISILCYLLDKNSKAYFEKEVFIAFIDNENIETRTNHHIFGFNFDSIHEGDLFRVNITTVPGTIYTTTIPATVNDWIWLNNAITIERLKNDLKNRVPEEKRRMYDLIERIPIQAQQLRNQIIDDIIYKP